MSHPLDDYGYNDHVAALVAATVDDGRVGRVVRVERGECDVATERGEERVLSDSQRSQDEVAPATGDWVMVADDPELGPVIGQVLERTSTLARRDPSEEIVEQVLAANVDTVVLVHGLDRPLRPGRLERFLVLVWESGAEPVVVLTKSDLADDAVEVAAIVRAVAVDVPVVELSAETGAGLDALDRWLVPGRTVALMGESGAGKSTLVNALVGHEVQATGEVRDVDAKGRHTTVTRDLVVVPGRGMLIDMPGIRAVGLWSGDDALHRVFGDIEELAADCRFGDCAHDHEPGCAVRAAIEAGEIDHRRLDRYRAMAAELAAAEQSRTERLRRSGSGRRGRRRH